MEDLATEKPVDFRCDTCRSRAVRDQLTAIEDGDKPELLPLQRWHHEVRVNPGLPSRDRVEEGSRRPQEIRERSHIGNFEVPVPVHDAVEAVQQQGVVVEEGRLLSPEVDNLHHEVIARLRQEIPASASRILSSVVPRYLCAVARSAHPPSCISAGRSPERATIEAHVRRSW